MNTEKRELTDRTQYFDYLRIFATFAVIILHVSSQNWYSTDVNGFDWQIFNFYNSIVRWCVPIFLMISGALFLPRNISIKKIYSKYILRMVTAFCVWSGIYCMFSGEIITDFIRGHYHMWFILMIIGIYICIPLIKEIVAKETLMKYFLIVSLLFTFIFPQLVILSSDFAGQLVVQNVSAIYDDVKKLNLHLVSGYVFYFILGYYLNHINLSKRQRGLIYILGLIGFILTIVLDLMVALKTQTWCKHYYGNFTVNVFLESIAVFIFFKHTKFKNKKIYNFVVILSKYSFGAYLVHPLIITQLKSFGLDTLSFNSAFSVPVIGIIVFSVSFSISAILNLVPVIKKYIV